MIFDILGTKKTDAQLEQEKEVERAWAMYGKEVEDFLNNNSTNVDDKFERLEKSKYAVRPKLNLQVTSEQVPPLSEDIKLRVKRGEIQESKAYRFMADPELGKMLIKHEGSALNDDKEIPLSEDLKQRVERGEIQASKAHRFMTDPKLKKLLISRIS